MSQTTCTITEALAELPLIEKKVQSKKEFILSFAVRESSLKDTLADRGGVRKVLVEEQQAIVDLLERRLRIKAAIAAANAATTLTIGKATRSISEWLIYKRAQEAGPVLLAELKELSSAISQTRNAGVYGGRRMAATEKPVEYEINVDEIDLKERIEEVTTILDRLDGLLSLKNATTTVSF